MRKGHREAAKILYEEHNKSEDDEIYVDLHGLHAEEAVAYLEEALLEQQHSKRQIYIITGTSHHSKNGKDKVSKAIRQSLVEWKCTFREFSVPSDRSGNVGSILGIDAGTFGKSLPLKREIDAGKGGNHLNEESVLTDIGNSKYFDSMNGEEVSEDGIVI